MSLSLTTDGLLWYYVVRGCTTLIGVSDKLLRFDCHFIKFLKEKVTVKNMYILKSFFIFSHSHTHHDSSLCLQGVDDVGQDLFGVSTTFPRGLYDGVVQDTLHIQDLVVL